MASSMVILLMSLNNTIDEAILMNLVETARSSFFTTYFSSIASPSSRMRPTIIMNFSANSSTDSASLILSAAHTSAAVSFSATRSSVSSSIDWEMIAKASSSLLCSTPPDAFSGSTAPHAPLVRKMYFILIAHAA
ncbi:hypothetical protein PVAP13_1KG269510 [Panicum virgatum]|uniref:Uncharacterized protein n=1 Tax=Panicum virgatum TaxID=38727 RepID=A0A8T0XLL3_PANVG|nr:hypothetical protein PVAP13_1KG269510 [Panicum virgatum]